MRDALIRLRENEPLQLILWPILGALATILVARGIVSDDVVSVVMAAAVAILGGSGVIAARSQVTAPAHLPGAVADGARSAVERVRGQVADVLGDPGVAALDQIDGMIQAIASERSGRHGRPGH